MNLFYLLSFYSSYHNDLGRRRSTGVELELPLVNKGLFVSTLFINVVGMFLFILIATKYNNVATPAEHMLVRNEWT